MKKHAFEVGVLVRRRHNWTVEGDLKSNFTGIVVSCEPSPQALWPATTPTYRVAWFNGNIGLCREYVLEAL
jgi:hypothetical protein